MPRRNVSCVAQILKKKLRSLLGHMHKRVICLTPEPAASLELTPSESAALLSETKEQGDAVVCDDSPSESAVKAEIEVESPGGRIDIPHQAELAQQLCAAVLEHRALKSLEHDADKQLSFLEDERDTLALQIKGLQDSIKDLKADRMNSEPASAIDSLYDAISILREAEEHNWQQQQRMVRHMSKMYKQFRDGQCVFYDSFDSMLIEEKLIPPEVQFTTTDNHVSDCSSTTTESPMPEPSGRLRRSSKPIAREFQSLYDSDQAAIHAKAQDAILDAFVAKRKKLGLCEQRFHAKEDLFDALAEGRMQRLKAGEEIDTATEFDHFMLLETQQMTRDLIEAEAEYDVSKAAAVKAGIQLRYSDLESGFVDDVDDGYRISMERDMVDDCDRERIEDWLMNMEDRECPTRYLSVRGFSHEMIEAGEGSPLKGITFSDSRSLVGEGAERKRIDKWNAQFHL